LAVGIQEFGAFGVPVFFLLSAYLITELLLREKEATGTINVRAFYIRRALRIWPLYFLALFVAFVVTHWYASTPMTLQALLAYICLVGNWHAFVNDALPLGFGILWSISVEEQFYLIWPSLVRFSSRRVILISSGLLYAISQATTFWLCKRSVPIRELWFNSIVQMQYFALGTIVSALLNGTIPRMRIQFRALMIVTGLTLMFIAGYVFHGRQIASLTGVFPAYFTAGIGALFLFLGFLGFHIPLPRMRHLVYFGQISYGLYIFHDPLLELSSYMTVHLLGIRHNVYVLKIALGLPLTFLMATLSYKYFEKPFLKLKERFEVVKSRPA